MRDISIIASHDGIPLLRSHQFRFKRHVLAAIGQSVASAVEPICPNLLSLILLNGNLDEGLVSLILYLLHYDFEEGLMSLLLELNELLAAHYSLVVHRDVVDAVSLELVGIMRVGDKQ